MRVRSAQIRFHADVDAPVDPLRTRREPVGRFAHFIG
jgi:hypothetical protein